MFRIILALLIMFILFPCYSNSEKTPVRQNLGEAINTEYDEIAPVISPDGKMLFFCRDGHPKNTGKKHAQDIWVSKLRKDGLWSTAENIGKPLNNEDDNFVNSVTPDGNTLLLGNLYGSKEDGFSISHKKVKGWSKPDKLIIHNYYNRSKYTGSYLSNDGKVMLYGIKRDDSYGDMDIYASFINDDESWSEPFNLGSVINTNDAEYSPFLASDGITLFFSSKGHGGLGEADIFMSRRLDETWKKWSKPENLGKPFNTSGNDAGFFIPASGDFAYLSSTDDSYGNGDIFKINLPDRFKPKPVILISGIVIDANTKEPVEAKVYYEILPKGTKAGIARSNPVDGEYKIILPAGRKYGFRAEADGYLPINRFIDAQDIKTYTEIEKNLELVPIAEGSVIRMNNIFFDFDKATLQEDSYPELNRLADFLKSYPSIKIEVSGHTDNVGSDSYNQKLSDSRAKTVTDYLRKLGIEKSRLVSKGYGETKPVADNSTDEGRELNRRVEFTILSK